MTLSLGEVINGAKFDVYTRSSFEGVKAHTERKNFLL